MQIIQTTGFSCAANVFDDDVPDEAPAEDAEAFPIDEVIDWNRRINNENVLINWKYYQSSPLDLLLAPNFISHSPISLRTEIIFHDISLKFSLFQFFSTKISIEQLYF